jgi:hypothetical protein
VPVEPRPQVFAPSRLAHDAVPQLSLRRVESRVGEVTLTGLPSVFSPCFKSELIDGRRFATFENAEHEVLHWIGYHNGDRTGSSTVRMDDTGGVVCTPSL